MSLNLISEYYNKVEKLIQYGGTKKETSVRNEFYNLLSNLATAGAASRYVEFYYKYVL